MHTSSCTWEKRRSGTGEEWSLLALSSSRDAVVWRGDTELPLCQQGIRVLGVPIGQPEFVRHFLEKKNQEHQTLFQRIPWCGCFC